MSISEPNRPLVTEADTLARVLAAARPLGRERVALAAALGRFTAGETLASVPLPGFDNSSMDGYALPGRADAAPWPAGAEFTLAGEQPAGRDRGLRVGDGEAVRIFTGAPLPGNTGAVVMQEDVRRLEDGPARIVLQAAVEPGEFIRRAGGDLARGQRLLAAGEKLLAPALAVLASQGLAEIEVGRRPRVAVLTTGDELRPPGSGPLAPGEIFESNGVLLAALAAGIVGAEQVVRLPHAPDEPAALDAALQAGLAEANVLVIAGGVSVGERDLVKGRLEALGARLELWRVRVKPGKPFVFGRGPARGGGDEGTHIFGLPGNPVSAFVTFLLFVRPALLRMMGANEASLALPAFPAVAAVELSNARGDRPHYLRGQLDAEGRFTPSGRQESHALAALSRSRALVRLEAGAAVPAGGPVRALGWEG